jgi:antibiotic biosynthesis monooxygenase (ABM) superfamily enzyme
VSEPVTVVVSRTVKPGLEARYESWLERAIAAARRFEGHLGADVLRAGGRRYVLLFRFASVEQLAAWETSTARRSLVEEAAPLTDEPAVTRATGLETWFTLPGERSMTPPPRWKMAVVSWLVAFPLIQILQATLGIWLAPLPALIRGALVGAAMIVTMTYAAMPLATRALARFLRPSA